MYLPRFILTLMRLAGLFGAAVGRSGSGHQLVASRLRGGLTNERLYQKAAAELDSGAGNRYQEMRDELIDYPLGWIWISRSSWVSYTI